MILVTEENLHLVKEDDYVLLNGEWNIVTVVHPTGFTLQYIFVDASQVKHHYYSLYADEEIPAYLATTEEEILQARLSCC